MTERKKKYRDKYWYTYSTQKSNDRLIRTPQKTEDELGCSERVGIFCSSSGGTRRVTLINNAMKLVQGHHKLVSQGARTIT